MYKTAAVIAGLTAGPAAACDLALALAVDVSASISAEEYALQLGGLADALLHPEVAEALTHGRAAVMLAQWSGQTRQTVTIPWRRISSADDMADLAELVRNAPRAWEHYSTAIGDALTMVSVSFVKTEDCLRHVIDVSGDGSSNEGIAPWKARDVLVSQGITINALAIESNVRGLARYFEENVIGGDNAFVEMANTFEDYPAAIERKLLREVVKPAF